jgi:hypothetical protein
MNPCRLIPRRGWMCVPPSVDRGQISNVIMAVSLVISLNHRETPEAHETRLEYS